MPLPSFPCPTSGKRGYNSPHAARLGTKATRNRIRVYFCLDCHRFHVTNGDRSQHDVAIRRIDGKVRHA